MADNISEKILLIVGEIKGEVKGINNRLDNINGSIKNHEIRINDNEDSISQQKGKATLCGAVTATVISAIGIAIAWLGLNK